MIDGIRRLEHDNGPDRKPIDVERFQITSEEMDAIYRNNSIKEKFGYFCNGSSFTELYVKGILPIGDTSEEEIMSLLKEYMPTKFNI